MGYYVDMNVNVTIPADKADACLAAISALHSQVDELGSGGSWSNGKKIHSSFSWVDDIPEGGWEDLKQAFEAWRYHTYRHDNGDWSVGEFRGQKWGDDELLFKAIAPYVAEGSSVVCYGEDNNTWRYLFEGGQAIEEQGEVSWGFGRPL